MQSNALDPANPLAPFAPFPNPFARPAADSEPEAVAADAPEGSYTYALLKSGPEIPADECEVAVASVEITLSWGSSVLHVAHLTPPRSFYVGEEERPNLACDYFLPAERIGATRAPVVLVSSGVVRAVVPAGAKATLSTAGGPRAAVAIEELVARGSAEPCPELAGAHAITLTHGTKLRIELEGGFVFDVATGNAGRKVGASFGLDKRAMPFTALSLLAHTALLGAMAFFMPPLGLTDDGEITPDQRYMISQTLAAAAEREQEAKDSPDVADANANDREGGTGARAKNEEGSMGSTASTQTGKRWAAEGPKDNPDAHLANRAAVLRDAADFGAIGLLHAMAGANPDAPTSPWGREDMLGRDPTSARGNMWGVDIGEAAGANGLGLSGIGDGGGGRFEGIGLGNVGTIGHGSGLGDGEGFGPGSGLSHGRGHGDHTPKAPRVRVGGTSVSGRLPPEVIQRIVRQNFGRFRLCYENGLRNNPNLAGRVEVRFVIGRDGAVSNVGNGASDLPDSAVVSCVVRAFYGLSFPQPEDGIVRVGYPIMFSPGG